MKSNNLTIEDYRAVKTLAEMESFRPAAQALGISPSRLSRLISAVEDRLGTRLFDRDTRNVRATHQGKVLAQLATRFLKALDHVETDFNNYLDRGQGCLTITGLPSITSGLLPPLLSKFSALYPEIEVKILDGLSHHVIKSLESGEADLGFTAGTDTTRSQLSFRKLRTDPFVAISNPEGPLAEDRPYSLKEITRHPFIAMSKGTSVRELVDSACRLQGVSTHNRYEVSHLTTAGSLIAQGLGVSVLPELTLPALGSSPIITRSIEDFGLARDIGIVWPSGTTFSPSAQAFWDLATA